MGMTWLNCFLIWKQSRPSHSRHLRNRSQAHNKAHSHPANSTAHSLALSTALSHLARNTAHSLAHSTTVHKLQARSNIAHSPRSSITVRSRRARNTVVDHLPLSNTVHRSTAHRHHLALNKASLPSLHSSCTNKAPLSLPMSLLALRLLSTLPNYPRSNLPNSHQ